MRSPKGYVCNRPCATSRQEILGRSRLIVSFAVIQGVVLFVTDPFNPNYDQTNLPAQKVRYVGGLGACKEWEWQRLGPQILSGILTEAELRDKLKLPTLTPISNFALDELRGLGRIAFSRYVDGEWELDNGYHYIAVST